MATVSKELQDTVRSHKGIKKVYFNEAGEHYFRTHQIDLHKVDDEGFSVGVEKVETLPGAKLGIVSIKQKTSGGLRVVQKKVNVSAVEPTETMTREEVLNAQALDVVMTKAQEDAAIELANRIIKQRGTLELIAAAAPAAPAADAGKGNGKGNGKN